MGGGAGRLKPDPRITDPSGGPREARRRWRVSGEASDGQLRAEQGEEAEQIRAGTGTGEGWRWTPAPRCPREGRARFGAHPLRARLVGPVLALILAMSAGLASPAGAGEFRSGFGFGISVPEVWLVLTRGEIERNEALFVEEEGGGEPALEQIPLAMRRAVFDRVRDGKLEIFYRRESETEGFVDNVNFLLQPAEPPLSADQLVGVCRALPTEFSRIFGRPIAMEACEMRERVRRPVLYLQFEGALPGTTTMQYQLPRGPAGTIVITATTASASLPRMLSEFEGMVESIRID